jgi:glycosyltransferase involved in cell wall biosynthesis
MLIGIDGNEANINNKVGSGQYAFELLTQFSSEKLKVQSVKFEIFLKDNPNEQMPQESKEWEYSFFGPRKLWTQIALPLRLYTQRKKPDIFFTPSHYAPRFSPVPTAISIMDMSFELYPEMFNKDDLYQLQNWTRYSAKNASVIFTISQASKNDIMKIYGIPDEKIVVTHLGVREVSGNKYQVSSMDELQKKYNIGKKYILFVGTLQPRKNIERLIEAFAKLSNDYSSSGASAESRSTNDSSRLRSNNNELDLIIIGKKGWQYEPILAAPEKYGVSDSVKFLDFVPDEDMPSFYTHAECFVLPSLYEGFGLPVLEAMKYGCPVLTSNVSSLPEAGGEAAIYFDPED